MHLGGRVFAILLASSVSHMLAQSTSSEPQRSPASPTSESSPANSSAPTTAGPYRVGGGVSAPNLIYDPDAEYFEQARKAAQQGKVVLLLVVDANGEPQNIRVQRSLSKGLDEQAIKSVKRWRFKPARKDGQPVPVIINVEVNFQFLAPHPESAGQLPRFPGVDTAKYPLVLQVSPVSFYGSGTGASSSNRAVITEGGRQKELTISCFMTAPTCVTLKEGAYPGRWDGDTTRLEILGVTNSGNWQAAEYAVVVLP